MKTAGFSAVRAKLKKANLAFNKNYPGESSRRQPVHTVYGGAQIFSSAVAQKMGASAKKHLAEFAGTPRELAQALGMEYGDGEIWDKVYARTLEKLVREAVEDFRIDFEDGYGNRPNDEEDGHARSTAQEVAKGMQENTLPPFIGLRIKPFNEERIDRSIRTLDIFLSTLTKATKKKLPKGFVITLPKVQLREQAEAFEKVLTGLEKKNGLKSRSLECELMVETPQSVIDRNGMLPMRSFIEAAKGRCTGAHFGTYDYTAGCNITATHQAMNNPVCDFAKHVMQVSLAGTPVFLSDGATNVMPVGDNATVHRAWRLSYKHIRHSLETGFYQGWDLHPAQLPIRYVTTYLFFLESYASAAARLSAFVDKAAKATLLGDVFDDAATGQGLLNYFLRGVSCGAISESEALSTGLTTDEFRSRSFLKILENRKLV